MEKNRKKKIVIIVLVVLFCLIIFFINTRTSKDITDNTIDSSIENTTEVRNEYDFGTDEYQEATKMKLQKVQGMTEYYTVLNCVNKFYVYYSSIYDSTSEISPEDSVSKIYFDFSFTSSRSFSSILSTTLIPPAQAMGFPP